ncbi:hypothetical protein VSH64_39515 [Amycolatopsis rhabdoformis]|uniref:Uncharacterized protein n=1 Tax=Amycolatopsis rhabdoformis TaxID=1448059 RepID=A0ABZ1I515_9PSEU|nr:hypothetical protein [Amycolatopsis rhabdoformis]WSE28856.1 hypothetical protein VSH64_39515 [Amycolatopsis rhabdoformis]
MPRKTALILALMNTTLAAYWVIAEVWLFADVTNFFTWLTSAIWVANAVYFWAAYIRARRGRSHADHA